MNPLFFLNFLVLPYVAMAYMGLSGLTAEELQHIAGDPPATHTVTFDVTISKSATESEAIGQLKFALFGESVPITVANFITTTEMKANGYQNSLLHRVVKDVIIQGGFLKKIDFKDYDPIPFEKFPTENFDILHNKPGRISLASTTGNTNGASFFISTGQSTPFFDGKYVSFGQLVGGFDVMKKINNVEVNGETPVPEILITHASYTDLSASGMPNVDFSAVHKKYSTHIYVIVGLIVLFVLYRYNKRRSLVDLKTFKL